MLFSNKKKKRIHSWWMQQHGWISKTGSWMKEGRHKGVWYLILLIWSSSTGIAGWKKADWCLLLGADIDWEEDKGVSEVQEMFSVCSRVMVTWAYTDVKIHGAVCALR